MQKISVISYNDSGVKDHIERMVCGKYTVETIFSKTQNYAEMQILISYFIFVHKQNYEFGCRNTIKQILLMIMTCLFVVWFI